MAAQNPTDRQQPRQPGSGSQPNHAQKDPDEWVRGEESMTAAQASCIRTLSQEAGEPLDDTLSKAEASKRIDELQ